ncbi:MAG: hypothetical protein JW801_03270 [Bacteroidales bacterium]|nr:hypothetical protein [Bacteroidales bacterium]
MRPILVILILILTCPVFYAQDSKITYAEQLSMNGYVRGTGYIGGNSAEQSILFSEISLTSTMDYQRASLFADVRFRYGEGLGNELEKIQIKELYGGYRGGKLDVLLGNQIVVWGRTDGFSPNDYMNSSDYFFLTPDQDDQRLPGFMLRSAYRLTPFLNIELLALPVYRPSMYRYDLFEMGDNVGFSGVRIPEKSFENGSLAGRLSVDLPALGFSVYGFYGYSPFYGFCLDTVDWSTGSPEILYTPEPYHQTSVGGDFDLALGNVLLRGEFAYKITEDYAEKMNTPNPGMDYVAALEYKLGPVSIIGQYIGKYTLDFVDLEVPVLLDPANPLAQWAYAGELISYESTLFNRRIFNQQEKTNHALSLIMSGQFFYSTLDVELAGYYNLTSDEYLIRPKMVWHVTDHLAFSLGGAFMGGPDQSIFDYSASVMNGIFTELRVSF